MPRKNLILKAVTASLMLAGAHGTALAIDSASAEFAFGNKVRMARVGAQWNWDRQWWQSNGRHIGGYWDLSLAQWRGNQYQNMPDRTQNITSLGITPVFRLQNDNLKGFYAEAGIGIHYLSDYYDNNDRQLSTHFQFGDHLGVGYVFRNRLDVNLKFQHFSNGSIKKPNDGVNFTVMRISYPF